ncbi:hypothetical protein H5410_015446 [Solanum commersonii]|uniref:Uncharacterized protein n=1 Tax=Solanum commersonii TaxID=4109 RepID=A0A9J5ZTP5_SOLCO|nr:hypothetical protein H5410_015446 [Solanum commersonii]
MIWVWDPLFVEAPNGNSAFTAESEISFPIQIPYKGSEIWKFPDFKNEFCPHFSSNFNLRLILHFESKLSDSKGKLQDNFEGNLAVISNAREASFEDRRGESIWRPLGEEKILRELEQRDRLWVGYGFLVRLSMLRHLFIDLLEYGGLVSSMLNFYNSALDLISKVLGYDRRSLDIINIHIRWCI